MQRFCTDFSLSRASCFPNRINLTWILIYTNAHIYFTVWVFIDIFVMVCDSKHTYIYKSMSVSASTNCRSFELLLTHSYIWSKCNVKFQFRLRNLHIQPKWTTFENTQHLIPSEKNRFRITKHIFKHWSQSMLYKKV